MKEFHELTEWAREYITYKHEMDYYKATWAWSPYVCPELLENDFIKIMNPITKEWRLSEKGIAINQFYNL
jgi:hypothetical protein